MRQAKGILKGLYFKGIEAVNATDAIRRRLRLSGSRLRVDGLCYNLKEIDNIYIVGAGKATAGMAQAVEEVLGRRIAAGVVVTPYGYEKKLKYIKLISAAHPVPDRRGLKGAEHILGLARRAGGRDLVICLISGGASALLPAPVEGITLKDKQLVTRLLVTSGASIDEINSVRKHLSRIKGGGLARACAPAQVLTLIISDVVGADPSTIGSGPTAPDPTTLEEALTVLKRYRLMDKIPARVIDALKEPSNETPDSKNPIFRRTHNLIIAENRTALASIKKAARAMGFKAMVVSSLIRGDVEEVAHFIAAVLKESLASANPLPPPCCIIFGGEPTVRVKGRGRGGRNQHLALLLARHIDGLKGIYILCAGTDGIDGYSDAAGAFVDGSTIRRASRLGLSAQKYIEDNDSYNFFKPLKALLFTGPTGTNVADVVICLIEGQERG